MNNKEKIEAINKWQKCNFVHPLICGKDKCNGILEPKIYVDMGLRDGELEEDIIHLECPNCDYIQEHIPEIIFNLNYEQFEKLEDLLND